MYYILYTSLNICVYNAIHFLCICDAPGNYVRDLVVYNKLYTFIILGSAFVYHMLYTFYGILASNKGRRLERLMKLCTFVSIRETSLAIREADGDAIHGRLQAFTVIAGRM